MEGKICASVDRGELGLEELEATGLEAERYGGGIDPATGMRTEFFGQVFADV